MIGREELFALAARPLGVLTDDRDGELSGSAVGRRAQKVWLPDGKRSASGKEVRERESELRALNFDIEDAIEAAGGQRGYVRQ